MIIKTFRYRERAVLEAVRWLKKAGRPEPIPLAGDGGDGPEWCWWQWNYPAAPGKFMYIILTIHSTGKWTLYVDGGSAITRHQPRLFKEIKDEKVEANPETTQAPGT